jgi:hypothetical protein
MTLDELEHHEAAHGAAAMMVGLAVRAVSIVPGYGARGYALVRVDPRSSRDAVRQIVATLAGLFEVFNWQEFRWGRLNPQRSNDEADILGLSSTGTSLSRPTNSFSAPRSGLWQPASSTACCP